MNTADNKRLIQRIHAELDKGNGQPFVDSLADNVRWTIQGRTPWSRTYEGKAAVRDELLTPLFAQFERPYLSTTERLIAEDDRVVVQFSGSVATKAGRRYANQYCYIYRVDSGKVAEITEYLDTALVDEVLEAPGAAAHGG